MFNKESCRACGTYLTPIPVCNFCKEYISWLCANVKGWKMLLILMTIAELLTRKRSKKLEIDENKCLTIINYLPSFFYISSISRNQSWIRTIVKLCL